MSEETITSVAEVLKNNKTLRVLKISQREDFSLNPVWDSLKHNQALTELEVPHIDAYFPDKHLDLDSLKEMTKHNRSITRLVLDKSFIKNDSEIGDLIQSFTERNKIERRVKVSNTLQTIAMISLNKLFTEILPREIWRNIFCFIKFPGIAVNFDLDKK